MKQLQMLFRVKAHLRYTYTIQKTNIGKPSTLRHSAVIHHQSVMFTLLQELFCDEFTFLLQPVSSTFFHLFLTIPQENPKMRDGMTLMQ